ncbi:unnamed protein product [Rotaria socialis]|uniref:Exportin-1/Importin-beta-like domain-containing protein n=1 Tax=Rotaria socialis TaxID=392032 RepID=A0A818Q4Y7_9BILA|nr:unnamed protein product [Rotaria socialis]
MSTMTDINMITNYSAEDIERIINSFYSPTSQLTIEQRQQLNAILENLQYSKLAWDFSWKLLDINKSASVQFFGAVALCNKISKHLSELDDNQIQQLFQQLIQRLIFYISIHSKQIITKLTVALDHLILHMIPDKWNNGIITIVNLFTQSQNEFLLQHPEKGHLIVLNILTILPEEFSRINVSKSQRSLIRLELEKEFPNVLNYLQFIISTYNQTDILGKIFSCLSKWLEFGISILQIEILFEYLFNSLNNENLFEDVCDCLTVLFTSPDALKYPSTFSRLFPYILQFEIILDQCLTAGNKEKAECITKLLTQFGENLAQLIVQMSTTPNSQMLAHNFCRLVMKCTEIKGQYPIDETCSIIALEFWNTLEEEVTSINEKINQEARLEFFRPYFEYLIEVLILKGQLPANENIFTNEDKETFRCYRSAIIETMICMHNALDKRAMKVLLNRLLISIEQSQAWQMQESIVQLTGAVSECISPDENQDLPHIFSLLPKLKFSNSLIMNTTLIVLGKYSSWLGNHPDILQHCVHLCINALSNPELIQSASVALKELIKENRMYMSKYLNDIFPIMKNVLENVHVQEDDRIRCLSIIGYILSGHPSKIVIDHLNIILVPEVNKLFDYLSKTNNNQENICTTLNFISVLLVAIGYYGDQNDGEENEQKYQTAQNPSNISEVLCCILRDLDPILQMIVKQYTDDFQVTEKICEILTRIVTILREASSLVLNIFVQLLQNMGPTILHDGFLSLVRNILLLFSKDVDKPVFNLFLIVLQKIRCLFNGDIQRLKNHVDTIEDVANFFSQVIKKLPNVVHQCPEEAFILFIEFIKIGIQLHEQGTLKSISTFTSNFIEYTKSNHQAANLLQQNGLEIVQILFKCIGGTSPHHLIEHLSLPLFTLSKTYFDWTICWVQQCLNDPNFPTPSASRHHRETLLKMLTAKHTSRSTFKDHITKFSLACRETISKENNS